MDSMIVIVVEVEKYNIYKYIHTYIKKNIYVPNLAGTYEIDS